MDWSPQDFAAGRTVDIGSSVAGVDVQAPLVLIGADFPVSAAADGSDLRFCTEGGEANIPYWIQQFDPAGKTAIIWLRLPAVPDAGSATIEMHWGNGLAEAASSYAAVFEKLPTDDAILLLHFDEAGGPPVDSSVNAYSVVPYLDAASWNSGDGGVNGIDFATTFPGGSSRKYLWTQRDEITGVLDAFPQSGCITLWMQLDTDRPDNGGPAKVIVQKINSSGERLQLAVEYVDGQWTLVYRIVAAGVEHTAVANRHALAFNQWQHVVLAWGPGGMVMWIDGMTAARNAFEGTPDDGNLGPLILGDPSNEIDAFYRVNMDELGIYPFYPDRSQVTAWHERRKRLAVASQIDKWVRLSAGSPIIGSITGQPTSQEPRVIKHPVLDELWIYYVRGFDQSAIRRATSTDGVTWTDQGVAMEAYTAGTFVGHHFVIFHDGTWYMFCVNGGVYSMATSADGITFTPVTGSVPGPDPLGQNPAIPWEAMVEDGWDEEPPFNPNHWSSPRFDESGQPVWWSEVFMQAGDEPYSPSGHIRHNDYVVPLLSAAPQPGWPMGDFGNTWATLAGGKWQMIVEAKDGSFSWNPWRLAYFESPPLGPEMTPLEAARQLTKVAGPFAELARGNPQASSSACMCVVPHGGRYHMWLYNSHYGSLPGTICHAVSTDLKAWARSQPIVLDMDLSSDILGSQDQVADPTVIEWHGKVWMYYDAFSNAVGGANIHVARYDGTLTDLLTDSLHATVRSSRPCGCLPLLGAGR